MPRPCSPSPIATPQDKGPCHVDTGHAAVGLGETLQGGRSAPCPREDTGHLPHAMPALLAIPAACQAHPGRHLPSPWGTSFGQALAVVTIWGVTSASGAKWSFRLLCQFSNTSPKEKKKCNVLISHEVPRSREKDHLAPELIQERWHPAFHPPPGSSVPSALPGSATMWDSGQGAQAAASPATCSWKLIP